MTPEPTIAEGIIGRWLALGGKSPGEDVENLVKILEDEIRAAILAERDGNEYWGMNQELTEQIATLREILVEIREIILQRGSD